MENLTQQQIEELIQFIDDAESPATITNTIVAAVLAFLAAKIAGTATAQALLNEIAARQIADSNLSTSIDQLQQLIQSMGFVVYLDSMGELDGDVDVHVDTGMVVYDPGNDIIKKYASPSQYESVSCDAKLLYCNKVTGYFYRHSTKSGMMQVGGGGGISEEDIINDLITGGRKKALSAEMGKWLAMMSGSYEQAWSRSKVVTSPFCWIWDETLSDGPVKKPIWHIGNSVFIDAAGSVVSVSAGDRPGTPSFSINGATPTDNMEVARNTQLTITPVAGAVLKYSIDDAEYITSDGAVTVTLTGSGTKTIKAYCSNSAGDSDLRTLRLVVSGIPEPSYAAGQDTTITTIGNDRIVTRGGVIVITGDEELHYRVGGGTWRTVPSSHGEAPTARVTIDGDKTIEAYNTVGGENSETVSWSFKMEALAPPSFLPEGGHEFGESGGYVLLQHPKTVDIYYNLNDVNDPDEHSTLFSILDPIHVTSRTTIKAIAKDDYGTSAVASASYTIAEAKITVKVNADTTMSLGDTGLTDIPLSAANNNGENQFTIVDINNIVAQMTGTNPQYTSFADHAFASLSFGDNTKIVTFDGGGMKVKNLGNQDGYGVTVWGAFREASSLTSVTGIVLAGGTQAEPSSLNNAFSNSRNLVKVELSGSVDETYMSSVFATAGANGFQLDIKNLIGKPKKMNGIFSNANLQQIDISGIDTSECSTLATAMSQCTKLTELKVGNLTDINSASHDIPNNGFFDYVTTQKLEKIIFTTNDVPNLKSSDSWLKQVLDKSPNVVIYVPDNHLADYQSELSTYVTEYGVQIQSDNQLSNN